MGEDELLNRFYKATRSYKKTLKFLKELLKNSDDMKFVLESGLEENIFWRLDYETKIYLVEDLIDIGYTTDFIADILLSINNEIGYESIYFDRPKIKELLIKCFPNQSMKNMLRISSYDKCVVREYFGITSEQFERDEPKRVDISIGENLLLYCCDKIMENENWEYKYGEDLTIEEKSTHEIYLLNSNYELDVENIADLVCLLKIFECHEINPKIRITSNDGRIYVEYDFFEINDDSINELLTQLGVKRIINKETEIINTDDCHELSEVESVILDRKQVSQTINVINQEASRQDEKNQSKGENKCV